MDIFLRPMFSDTLTTTLSMNFVKTKWFCELQKCILMLYNAAWFAVIELSKFHFQWNMYWRHNLPRFLNDVELSQVSCTEVYKVHQISFGLSIRIIAVELLGSWLLQTTAICSHHLPKWLCNWIQHYRSAVGLWCLVHFVLWTLFELL